MGDIVLRQWEDRLPSCLKVWLGEAGAHPPVSVSLLQSSSLAHEVVFLPDPLFLSEPCFPTSLSEMDGQRRLCLGVGMLW